MNCQPLAIHVTFSPRMLYFKWGEIIALVLGGQPLLIQVSSSWIEMNFSYPLKSCVSGEDSTLLSAAFGLDKEPLIFMGASNGFLDSRLLRELYHCTLYCSYSLWFIFFSAEIILCNFPEAFVLAKALEWFLMRTVFSDFSWEDLKRLFIADKIPRRCGNPSCVQLGELVSLLWLLTRIWMTPQQHCITKKPLQHG